MAYEDAFALFIASRDFSQNHRRILTLAKNRADWSRNLAGREHRRCHLVQQWLKEVVVCAVNKGYFRWGLRQGLGGGQTAESPTYDNDTGWIHLLLASRPQRAADDSCLRFAGTTPPVRRLSI